MQNQQQIEALKLAEEMLTAISKGKTYPAREYMEKLHSIRAAIPADVPCGTEENV